MNCPQCNYEYPDDCGKYGCPNCEHGSDPRDNELTRFDSGRGHMVPTNHYLQLIGRMPKQGVSNATIK